MSLNVHFWKCVDDAPCNAQSSIAFHVGKLVTLAMRLAFAFFAAALLVATAAATPLDDYVNAADPSFNFVDTGIRRGGNGWTGYVYNLTSQTWLTTAESDRPVWWHWLIVIIPHDVVMNRSKALLYITGGDNSNPTTNSIPSDSDEDLFIAATVAVSARAPAAVLYQVPNQPILFPCDPFQSQRVEDAAIALTWWYFVNNPTVNPAFILELPMTKAGVRALDAMEQIIPQYTGGGVVNEFMVAGASKRGWTTWLVGAVDPRVVAIAPIVLDALNVVNFAHRQWQMYGAWTFALQDYYKMNITEYWDHPSMTTLMQIVDPWYYLPRLTMPKLAINAGGDEFQMPDDQRHWGHDTVGEMHYLLVKNAEHSMATGIPEVLQGAGAFIQAIVNDVPRPAYTWEYNETNGDITVNSNIPPTIVTVAYADSAMGPSTGRRDFRWAALNVSFCPVKVFGACVRPVLWTTSSTEGLTQVNATAYRVHMEPPTSGWRAFTIEMQWNNRAGPDDFYFTAPASVVPPTYPFPDCHGDECKGTLI
jgi:PhoPQ-activated pathogenicity-related protein